MSRMSREFSLVLVGAGILTAGYFAWPEQDFEKRAEEQANQRVGRRSGGGGMLIFIHGGGGSHSVTGGARAATFGSVSRSAGGLGSIGGRVSGGGGGG